MSADGSWGRYEDGRKSSQTHESEIVFRAAGLSVVEAVDVHVHFLNFLGAVIERVCRVDSGCDGDDHFGRQHRAVAALDALGCDAEDLHIYITKVCINTKAKNIFIPLFFKYFLQFFHQKTFHDFM